MRNKGTTQPGRRSHTTPGGTVYRNTVWMPRLVLCRYRPLKTSMLFSTTCWWFSGDTHHRELPGRRAVSCPGQASRSNAHESGRMWLSANMTYFCPSSTQSPPWKPPLYFGKSPSSGMRKFKDWFCHLRAAWLWVSYLHFLNLGSLICQVSYTQSYHTQ